MLCNTTLQAVEKTSLPSAKKLEKSPEAKPKPAGETACLSAAELLLILFRRDAGRLLESHPKTVRAMIAGHLSDSIQFQVGLRQELFRFLDARAMQFRAWRPA